jgi:hypothetical protein
MTSTMQAPKPPPFSMWTAPCFRETPWSVCFCLFVLKKGWVRISDLTRFVSRGIWGLLGGEKFRGWHQNKQHLKDKDPAELDRLAADCFHAEIRHRISQAGREAVEGHRRAGHLVVLLTGSLEPLANQLARILRPMWSWPPDWPKSTAPFRDIWPTSGPTDLKRPAW